VGNHISYHYVSHSVGIATGLLLASIHNAGLVGLPYTPAKMAFLKDLLGRDENERPFLVLAAGYPAGACNYDRFSVPGESPFTTTNRQIQSKGRIH
jgi:hypothetical protein